MSDYLLAPLVAWVIAQTCKFVIDGIRNKHFNLRLLRASGDMPSVHSALISSVTTVIGLQNGGLQSPVFALAIVLSLIVMYDAFNVRRAVGEQGRVLRSLDPKAVFKQAKGHTPMQVLAGLSIGVIVACVVVYF